MSETGAKVSEWALPSANTSHGTSAPTFASATPGHAEAASKSSSKGTILIVEDDKAARLAITRILKKRGFAVCDVGCLADAMQSLSSRRIGCCSI